MASGTSWAQRVLGRPGPSVADVNAGRARPLTARCGLFVVDAQPWSSPADAAQVEAAIRRLTTGHSFVILDIDNDTSPVARAALALAEHIVVVTNADPAAIATVAATIDRSAVVPGSGTLPTPGMDVPRATVVIVLSRPGGLWSARRRLRAEVVDEPLVVAYDPAFAQGKAPELDQLRRSTRNAYFSLVTAVMLTSS